MNKDIDYLIEKLQPYRGKGYSFSFDTNVLMDSPSILKKFKKEPVWISRKV